MLRLIRRLYLVDVSDHQLEISTDLPSHGNAFHFKAVLNFTCRVQNPATVVERGVNDVGSVLRPQLVAAMRHSSRQCEVENSGEAEHKIAQALSKSEPLHEGLTLANFVVRLDLDDATLEHLRERKRLEQSQQLLKLQGDLERMKTMLEVERQEKYLPLIQAGNWSLLALFMAHHPDRMSEVMSVMMSQQQDLLDKQLQTLRFFLDKDVVEKSEFEDRGRQLLKAALEKLLPGIEEEPKPGRKDVTPLKVAGKEGGDEAALAQEETEENLREQQNGPLLPKPETD